MLVYIYAWDMRITKVSYFNALLTDVTDVALEWAERNVKSNPHVSELIEIRKVEASVNVPLVDSQNKDPINDEIKEVFGESINGDVECLTSSLPDPTIAEGHYSGPPILCGVVMDDETFDFCMCNPPFFESMEEAGLNPKTACGGTPEEMVCPGGEKAFIYRLIDDSVKLKQSFRYCSWFMLHSVFLNNLKICTI